MDGYCRYVPGYPRITGYWDKGGYEGSWNCCTVGKPVLQWRWGVPHWGNWLPETLLAAMTCTAAWVSYVGLPSVLYVRTVGGCLCRLGLGSSSELSGGLLLSWVRVSRPFPLSDPVSSVSSKTLMGVARYCILWLCRFRLFLFNWRFDELLSNRFF